MEESLITIVMKSQEYFKQIRGKASRFGMDNCGFPFIGGFIVLLFVAAIFLAGGWASVAEATADAAYFALVIGVVLQLVCFGRNRLKNGVAP